MAVTEKKNIWFWSSPDGTHPPVKTYQMAASQGALMPGAPVELNASGLCELSDTDDTQILGYVVGIPSKSGSTAWPLTAQLSANDEVRVAIARAGDIYAVYADNNDSDTAVSQANVGDVIGIRVSSLSGAVGYVTADVNETSNTMFTVVDIAANVNTDFAVTDNPGVLLVKHSGTLQG